MAQVCTAEGDVREGNTLVADASALVRVVDAPSESGTVQVCTRASLSCHACGFPCRLCPSGPPVLIPPPSPHSIVGEQSPSVPPARHSPTHPHRPLCPRPCPRHPPRLGMRGARTRVRVIERARTIDLHECAHVCMAPAAVVRACAVRARVLVYAGVCACACMCVHVRVRVQYHWYRSESRSAGDAPSPAALATALSEVRLSMGGGSGSSSPRGSVSGVPQRLVSHTGASCGR